MSYSVEIKNGILVPSHETARAMVKGLRSSLKDNKRLMKRFERNPRRVLANRGFTLEMQNELLADMGRSTRMEALECGCTGCCATSSFCCETL